MLRFAHAVRVGCGCCFASVMLALGAPSVADAVPNNKLACDLIANQSGFIRQSLGVGHIEEHASAESPTVTQPGYDHTVDGSDESVCDVLGWTGKKPSGSGGKPAGPPKYAMAKGRAIFEITTNVRDDTPQGGGNTWNPVQFEHELLQVAGDQLGHWGGHSIPVPAFGHNHHAYWIGSKNHAIAFWYVGDSIIQLNLVVPGGKAPADIAKLAKNVVAKF